MNKNYLISGIIGGGVLWFIFSKGKGKGLTHPLKIKVPRGGPQSVENKIGGAVARGIRNNNPGNISRSGGDNWQGLTTTQADGEYFQFISAEYGLRALAIILRNYQTLYNIRSVRTIISRYGPKGDEYAGNVIGYIDYTSSYLGVDKDQAIDLYRDKTLIKVMQSIVNFENGYNPYSVGKYKKAIALI